MKFRKKTFSRRPSRRRIKRDVLTLSVSFDQVVIDRPVGGNSFGPNSPFADAIVLWHGGKHSEAGLSVQDTASALQDDAMRGVSVRGIQFDWAGFASCWIETGSPNAAQKNSAHIISHYMALVKADFDQDIYETTGQVVPKWNAVPNIIRSSRDIALGSAQELAFDPPVDIMWRGYEEAISRHCVICAPCPSDIGCPDVDSENGCITNIMGVQGIGITGTVNMPLYAFADESMSRHYALRHVKLRTSRFLKEDQCLVLVSNWVTTIPEGSQVVWSRTLYGNIAARVAR